MQVLETDRLLLRYFSADDVEFVVRLLNEPSFIEHIGDKGVRTSKRQKSISLRGHWVATSASVMA